MARAIFGTYPEIEIKWKFLIIPIVILKTYPLLFLEENLIQILTDDDFPYQLLIFQVKPLNRISKSKKIRFFFSKFDFSIVIRA